MSLCKEEGGMSSCKEEGVRERKRGMSSWKKNEEGKGSENIFIEKKFAS